MPEPTVFKKLFISKEVLESDCRHLKDGRWVVGWMDGEAKCKGGDESVERRSYRSFKINLPCYKVWLSIPNHG